MIRMSELLGSVQFSGAEPDQVAVPEDRVLVVDLQPVHDALGQSERAALRHGPPLPVSTEPHVRHQTAYERHKIGDYLRGSVAAMQGVGG